MGSGGEWGGGRWKREAGWGDGEGRETEEGKGEGGEKGEKGESGKGIN